MIGTPSEVPEKGASSCFLGWAGIMTFPNTACRGRESHKKAVNKYPGYLNCTLSYSLDNQVMGMRTVLSLTVTLCKIVCVLIAISLIIATICFATLAVKYISEIPPGTIDKLVESTVRDNVTIIYDDAGQTITVLNTSQTVKRVPYSKIPKNLINAFVAIEDERFWKHNGIDVKRIIGAIVHNLQKRSLDEGASTITQQLVRNKLSMFEKTLKRKIQEQYLAIMLEKRLTKQQILEAYLNTINLGNGAFGVQAAAHVYFNKDVSQLTLAECALIAGITKNPAYYDPYRYPEHAKARQELVLEKMLELGYITAEEFAQAVNQKLVFAKKSTSGVRPYKHTYFVDSVIEETIDILERYKGLSRNEAEEVIFNGGLKIYTTMDEQLQTTMEKIFSDSRFMPKIRYYTSDGIPQPQVAAVLIDFRTGEVKGIMGGRGNIKGIRVFNRATMSVRQPGSAIKPIAVYSLALERGYKPWSVVLDAPFSVGGYTPKDWYVSENGYKGYMTLRQALEWSANVPAVRLAYQLGIRNVFENLKKFGFTTLSENDKNNLAIAIGGFTYGVKLIELTAAFGCIANDGVYIKPHFVKKIVDSKDNTIYEYVPDKKRVMLTQNAHLLTDMLKSVVEKRITVNAEFDYPVAGKTGTTDDNKDRWFVGYTPDYVLGVWVGEDNPAPLDYLGKNNPAVKIFKSVMDEIVKENGLKHKYWHETTTHFVNSADVTEKHKINSTRKRYSHSQTAVERKSQKKTVITLSPGSKSTDNSHQSGVQNNSAGSSPENTHGNALIDSTNKITTQSLTKNSNKDNSSNSGQSETSQIPNTSNQEVGNNLTIGNDNDDSASSNKSDVMQNTYSE